MVAANRLLSFHQGIYREKIGNILSSKLMNLWHCYMFFSFQNLVNKMWIGVASQDKMEIRSCLPKLLLAQHKTVPYFIRNKLCKVIVDIGRQDWPMFYHDFFTNTLQVGPGHVRFSQKGSSQTVLLSCHLGCNITVRWFCLCLIMLRDSKVLSGKVLKWTDSAQEIISPIASYSRSCWPRMII